MTLRMNSILTLATDGKAHTPILICKESGRVTRFAARELAKYLHAMSGVRFTIREVTDVDLGNDLPAILVGPGRWERQLDESLDACTDPFDGYTLLTADNKLFVRGHNARSTLYGVYDLLERLGCHFVEPGIEHVPKLKRVVVPALHVREVAAFTVRNIFRNIVAPFKKMDGFRFLDPELFVPQIDWMAKRRLNHHDFYIDYYRFDLWEKYKGPVLDALLDRGFTLEETFHSLHYFCPPDENHDFGDWGSATYQRNHPDWYLPAYECGPRGRWQTRVELPVVQKIVIERYLDYVGRNPELEIVGLWPDDIAMNNPAPGLNPSDGYLKFWNRAADALKGAFPEKYLGIIAYFELIKPPRKVMPRANEHCWYCPLERNFHYPLRDARNKKFHRYLKPWVKTMAPQRLVVFDYYGWSVPFIPYRDIMRDDFALYHEAGAAGVYAWSGFTHNLLGEDNRWAADFYALSHLLWNPHQPVRPLEEAWTRGVFGSAAGQVLDFLDCMKAAHQRAACKGLKDYIMMEFAGDNRWIDVDLLHKAQAILAGARKATNDERASKRIDQLEKLAAHGITVR